MKGLVSDFYKRSNAVIASFNVRDNQTLNHNHIYSVFCSSLYYIELFNYSHTYIPGTTLKRLQTFTLMQFSIHVCVACLLIICI